MITPVYSPVGWGGRLDPLRESIGMVTLSCRVEMRNQSVTTRRKLRSFCLSVCRSFKFERPSELRLG